MTCVGVKLFIPEFGQRHNPAERVSIDDVNRLGVQELVANGAAANRVGESSGAGYELDYVLDAQRLRGTEVRKKGAVKKAPALRLPFLEKWMCHVIRTDRECVDMGNNKLVDKIRNLGENPSNIDDLKKVA